MVRRSLAVVFVLATSISALADRPSIVLITIDTVRADRVGFLGSVRKLTPNLDSLATKGVVFEHAYAQAPITTTSHATILTGTYPQFHRVSDFGTRLPSRIPDLAEVFKQHGYRTAAFVGSIILDPSNGLAPGFDRGFDIYDAGFRLRQPGEDRYKTVERRADEVVAHAMGWLRENAGHSFFIWIHLYDAHQPYDPPAEYAKRFFEEPYDGEIAYADAALGTLLAYFHGSGIDKSSAIAVMSDHGEALGQHGEKGHGIFLYDETVHVPLLIKLPKGRFAGKRVHTRVRLVDVAPTLVEVAGLFIPEDMQGESLLGTLTPEAVDRVVYSETDYPEQGFGWSKLWSLRDGKYLFVDAPRRELYDTTTDPLAKHNIAEGHAAVVETLATRLSEMRRRDRSALVPLNEGVSLSASQKEALAALGYVSRNSNSEIETPTGKDPKDYIQVANQLQDAMLLLDSDHPDRAIPLLQQVVTEAPNIYLAQLELGRAESRQRNYAAAVAALTKATELVPQSGIAQYELGLALFESGDKQSAATHFEEAVARAPEMANAHFSLAAVYARIDRVADAERELHTALNLDVHHYRANLLLGRILFLQGHCEEALPYLEKAVSVQPESKEAHSFLAEEYAQLGLNAESRREKEKAAGLPSLRP